MTMRCASVGTNAARRLRNWPPAECPIIVTVSGRRSVLRAQAMNATTSCPVQSRGSRTSRRCTMPPRRRRRRCARALGGRAPDLPARRARPPARRRGPRAPGPARPPRRRGAAAAQRAPPRAGRDPRGRRDARRPRGRRAARAPSTSSSPSPLGTPRCGRAGGAGRRAGRGRGPRGGPVVPGAVAVTSPLALRARRVRALVVARLAGGDVPGPAAPEPFLGDAERRALNAASACGCASTRTRWTASGCSSTRRSRGPTERLALSWHVADDDGAPRGPVAAAVDDVRDLFAPSLLGAAPRAGAPLGAVERAAERDAGPSARSARLTQPARSWPRSPRARQCRPRGWRRGRAARCAGSSSASCARARSRPTPSRCARAAGPRRPGGGPAHRLRRTARLTPERLPEARALLARGAEPPGRPPALAEPRAVARHPAPAGVRRLR